MEWLESWLGLGLEWRLVLLTCWWNGLARLGLGWCLWEEVEWVVWLLS